MVKVLITGAGGYLGRKLAKAILAPDSPIKPTDLILTDIIMPPNPDSSKNFIKCIKSDFSDKIQLQNLVDSSIDIIYALHGIMSGQSETDYELGMSVNFDSTRSLLETIKVTVPKVILVYTSSLAVFGGTHLPDPVEDTTQCSPQTSYGTEKAMCELLINDFSRRGWVDGRCLRLPTITIRSGNPSSAASSYVSGIIREPLQGLQSNCPVPLDFAAWTTSPNIVIRNIIQAAVSPASDWGDWRAVSVCGLSVTPRQMIAALEKVGGKKATDLITFKEEPAVWAIAKTWPGKSTGYTYTYIFFKICKKLK